MPSVYEYLDAQDINLRLHFASQLRISHVWRSIGSAIFLELGELRKGIGRNVPRGQATISIESEWRVERSDGIHFGSGFETKQIDDLLASLLDVKIISVAVEGRVPEVVIRLNDGRILTSFMQWHHQPQWGISIAERNLMDLGESWKGIDVVPHIGVHNGRLGIEYCYDAGSPEPSTLPKPPARGNGGNGSGTFSNRQDPGVSDQLQPEADE